MQTESVQQSPSPRPGSPASSYRFRFVLFLLIAALVTAADLGTKRLFFERLGFPSGNVEWAVENVFGFQTSLNQGALWGFGSGRTFILVAISFAALVGIGFWLRAEARKSLTVVISLSLITGGILGNLWDRLALHGIVWPADFIDYSTGKQVLHAAGTPVYAVRDWILVMIGSYHWPNFNIADAALVCGVILMILRVVLTPSPKTERVSNETGTAG